jgi:hypothetical protein
VGTTRNGQSRLTVRVQGGGWCWQRETREPQIVQPLNCEHKIQCAFYAHEMTVDGLNDDSDKCREK